MRLAFWRQWPLAAQLTLAMATLVAVSVIIIIVLYVNATQTSLRRALQRQAEVILVTLATSQANSMYVLDTDALETAMESLGDAQTGVLARVYDSEGRLVADSAEQQALVFGIEPDPFGKELIHSDDLVARWNPSSFEAGRQVIVGRELIGAISVQITTEELEVQLQEALLQGLLLAVVGVGVGIVVSLLISGAITQPINAISKVAKRIAEGDLTTRAEIANQQEIGALGQAVNTMLDSIQKRDTERSRLITDLQAAKRLAEENSRLKSEFLSTMSHELRTPMNAIEGFTSIVLSRMGGVEFNEKTERYIRRVNVNSKRLLQLINDFLDLSRVESGRLELAHQPFSPAELAWRWQTEIGVLAEKKQIGLDLTLDPHLPEMVYGDEEAVSKVAINLLSNAIKFTEQGKVSLTLTNGGDNWRIIVTDTGIGIPPHAREFVFEEFRQVDQTSKRKYGGTGLGLAIVQKYTRSMGGTVSLQSELGVGSTFTVTLPLDSQSDSANGA